MNKLIEKLKEDIRRQVMIVNHSHLSSQESCRNVTDIIDEYFTTRPARDEVFNLLKRFAEYEFEFGENQHQAEDYVKHFMESDAFKSVMNIDNNAVPKSDNSASPTTEQIVDAVMKLYGPIRYKHESWTTKQLKDEQVESMRKEITNAINEINIKP